MIIDVSRHQGEIDWFAAAQVVDYAIIRSSLGSVADVRYYQNWIDSHRANIQRRTIYHYYVTEILPLNQLEAIRRITQDDFGNAPFTLDCERREDEKDKPFDRVTYSRNITTFLNEYLRRYSHPLTIYTSDNEWKAITVPMGDMSKFGLHVADYRNIPDDAVPIPRGWTDWKLRQYSATGRVPGVNGDCDLNREREAALDPVDSIRASANSILDIVGR